jgi:hypothetical protein
MKRALVYGLGLVVLASVLPALTGCQRGPAKPDGQADMHSKHAKKEASHKPMAGKHGEPATKGLANARCPIMGAKLNPAAASADLLRTYKGQKVGFCCKGCPAAWDKLADKDKDAKLHAAL